MLNQQCLQPRVFLLKRRPLTCSFVLMLFLAGGPPTVGGLVIPVDINAVDGVPTRWPQPHISQEISERALPPRADGNSSASVPRPPMVPRIKTAMFHAPPRHVLRTARRLAPRPRPTLSVGLARPRTATYVQLGSDAAAALGVPVYQMCCSNHRHTTTYAQTSPMPAALSSFSESDDSQPAKGATTQIKSWRHLVPIVLHPPGFFVWET